MSIKICLDAGHYGKYNRSPVVPEYYESDMVWKLHMMQKTILEGYGFEVITTRENQATDRGLFERGKASAGCALFISNHSNACGKEYVDYPVAICLLDDSKIVIDDEARRIGEILAKVVQETMGTKQAGRVSTRQSANDRDGNGIHDDEYYGVLHGAKMAGTPALILEHSFHTNTRATQWLLDDNNLRKLAEAECRAIAAYYGMDKQEEPAEEDHNMSKAEFIEFVGKVAMEDWKQRKICLPSVVVAQAIKESGAGTSELAQNANAIFGIKKNGWTGETYIKDAGEQNPDGTYRTDKNVEWRKYGSWRESIIDHNDYIATRKIGKQTEPNYKAVIGETDYRKAVEALQSAEYPYATSLTYAESLINDYILKYNLTRFDGDNVSEDTTSEETMYRIQAGAYRGKDAAEDQKKAIISKGIDAIIIEEDGMYKVQAGLYRVKANADAQLNRVTDAGFDAFIKVLAGTKAEEKKEIAVGDTVTVLKNTTYEGKSFKTWYDKYDVISISGDRVVIGIGETVTCAIHKENIAPA